MEWSKSTISKSELEKKQKEYMEAALNMAKKAGNTAVLTSSDKKEEIVEELVEEIDDLSETLEEIKEQAEKITDEIIEEAAEDTASQPEEPAEHADVPEKAGEKSENYGVFDTEELMNAIESGEVSGEGLKQAAEILEEMTRKTDTMKKLIEEQETENFSDNGADYGLNSFINKHNSHCRGCTDGKSDTP